MSDHLFTYWADSLARARHFAEGCRLVGIEGSDDPEDECPFTGVFESTPEEAERFGCFYTVRIEWRGDPDVFIAEFEED